MLIKDVNGKILWHLSFTLNVKIVKNILYDFLSSHLKAHSHLMLEEDFHIMSQITTDVNLQM